MLEIKKETINGENIDIINYYDDQIFIKNDKVLVNWEPILNGENFQLTDNNTIVWVINWYKREYTIDAIIFIAYEALFETYYNESKNTVRLLLKKNGQNYFVCEGENVTWFWKYKWKIISTIRFDDSKKWSIVLLDWKEVVKVEHILFEIKWWEIVVNERRNGIVIWMSIESFFEDYGIEI